MCLRTLGVYLVKLTMLSLLYIKGHMFMIDITVSNDSISHKRENSASAYNCFERQTNKQQSKFKTIS